MTAFPDKVAVDEVYRLVDEGNVSDFETFDDYSVARRFGEFFEEGLSDRKTQLYTQVDAEEDVAYLKGKHLVNRTGVYLVMWE